MTDAEWIDWRREQLIADELQKHPNMDAQERENMENVMHMDAGEEFMNGARDRYRAPSALDKSIRKSATQKPTARQKLKRKRAAAAVVDDFDFNDPTPVRGVDKHRQEVEENDERFRKMGEDLQDLDRRLDAGEIDDIAFKAMSENLTKRQFAITMELNKPESERRDFDEIRQEFAQKANAKIAESRMNSSIQDYGQARQNGAQRLRQQQRRAAVARSLDALDAFEDADTQDIRSGPIKKKRNEYAEADVKDRSKAESAKGNRPTLAALKTSTDAPDRDPRRGQGPGRGGSGLGVLGALVRAGNSGPGADRKRESSRAAGSRNHPRPESDHRNINELASFINHVQISHLSRDLKEPLVDLLEAVQYHLGGGDDDDPIPGINYDAMNELRAIRESPANHGELRKRLEHAHEENNNPDKQLHTDQYSNLYSNGNAAYGMGM